MPAKKKKQQQQQQQQSELNTSQGDYRDAELILDVPEAKTEITPDASCHNQLRQIFGDGLAIGSAFTHPTFEAVETFGTIAWFINMLGASESSSLSTGAVFAASVFLKEALFVTFSRLETITGKTFTGEQKNAVFTAILESANLLGCVAGGMKFSAGMYGVLSQQGSDLGTLDKLFIFSVGFFRYFKERLVSMEIARENLKKMGFESTFIDTLLNKVPVINGQIYLTDIHDFIIKNQATIEGGLHGLAVFKSLKQIAGLEKADMMALITKHLGKGVGIIFASLIAASGEKAAQRFDAEQTFIQKYKGSVAELAEKIEKRRTQTSEDNEAGYGTSDTEPLPNGPASRIALKDDDEHEESQVLTSSREENSAKTLTSHSSDEPSKVWIFLTGIKKTLSAINNIPGVVAGKIIDTASLLMPLYHIFPNGAHQLVKVAGNAAFGIEGANAVTTREGAFQPKNPALIDAITYGFPAASAIAAFAQYRVRQSGADHLFAERYGQSDDRQQLSGNISCNAIGHLIPKCSWDNFCKSFIPDADAITEKELEDAMNHFADFLFNKTQKPSTSTDSAENIFNRNETNEEHKLSIRHDVIKDCTENPALGAQLVLMERAVKKLADTHSAADFFPNESKRLAEKFKLFQTPSQNQQGQNAASTDTLSPTALANTY